MSDLIRREDIAKAIAALSQEFLDGGSPTAVIVLNLAMDRINALPPVQPDAADIRIATLQKAEESLRKWQDNLILCGYKEAPITVGMAADLIATLKGETT